MICKESTTQRGFSLVEVLVVLAVMGLVMVSVYSYYLSQQRSSMVEEDVVEVQQNLRIAMEQISRDIKMAGFILPSGTNPVASFPSSSTNGVTAADADVITINTASAAGAHTWINKDYSPMTVTAGSDITFTVAANNNFAVDATRQIVRIVNPLDNTQPVSTTYTVEGVGSVDASCGGAGTAPCLVLKPAAGGSSITFAKGYVIARTGKTGTDSYPNTIRYSLGSGGSCPSGQNCIIRNTQATGDQIVATNIETAGLQFRYIMDDGSEADEPTGIESQIRAVRVTVNAVTTSTVAEMEGNPRQRSMTSVVDIRNR